MKVSPASSSLARNVFARAVASWIAASSFAAFSAANSISRASGSISPSAIPWQNAFASSRGKSRWPQVVKPRVSMTLCRTFTM